MINNFPYLEFYAVLCPPYSHNVRHIAAVAASTNFPREQRRESSKYCPREVMPPLRQTLVVRCGCHSRYFPITVFVLSSPNDFLECVSARSQRIALAIFCLCGFAIWCLCVGFAGWQHDIANMARRPPLLFQHLSRHFSCFCIYFHKVNSYRKM